MAIFNLKPKVKFLRGEKNKVKESPIKNGQVLFGVNSNNTLAIYADIINSNGELIRLSLDLSEYTEKITMLENKVKQMEAYIANDTFLVINTGSKSQSENNE